MLSYPIGQLIILLIFECRIIKVIIYRIFIESFSQMIENVSVIQNTVHITSPAIRAQIISVCAPVFQQCYRFLRSVAYNSCPSHMYFISFAGFRLRIFAVKEREVALFSNFLRLNNCALRQKSQARNNRNISFQCIRIFQPCSHHLISATNADDFLSVLEAFHYYISDSIGTQVLQVCQSVL